MPPRESKRYQKAVKMEGNQWLDLPLDLVLAISDRLGLIDLLRFRGVCNYWRSSTSHNSAEIPQPWFLLRGETAECSILTNDHRIYRIDIPEMAEAICLASFVGWFLLYCKSSDSLFFFCPFSRAILKIPQCPLFISEQSEAESDFSAAFSSYPTDPDCTVVIVVKPENDEIMRLWILRRGESKWGFHESKCPSKFGKIKSVATYERAFHFLDKPNKWLVSFEYDKMKWINYKINYDKSGENSKRVDYWVDKNWVNKKSFSLKSEEMKQLLGIQDPCSISICGAMVLKNGANERVISHEFLGENVDDDEESMPRRELKGVWFQPRFHQISKDQRW